MYFKHSSYEIAVENKYICMLFELSEVNASISSKCDINEGLTEMIVRQFTIGKKNYFIAHIMALLIYYLLERTVFRRLKMSRNDLNSPVLQKSGTFLNFEY